MPNAPKAVQAMVMAVNRVCGQPEVSKDLFKIPVQDQEGQYVILIFRSDMFKELSKVITDLHSRYEKTVVAATESDLRRIRAGTDLGIIKP